MAQYNYETQSEKYDFIAGQHGGYHRHGFIDHAYLYNLYFPPEAVFTNFKDKIHDIVLNYPVAQDDLAGLISNLIHQPAERIVVGNYGILTDFPKSFCGFCPITDRSLPKAVNRYGPTGTICIKTCVRFRE